ncbi:hypothetical protein J4050_10400 [Winogradskyella sp. DF17]|uniref:Uncharacterized protein n=1 Tax=Winogradskyella pelagia TaxID=2819984 RepID=A0ABS3T4H6_9FLAO|nr:hypothetical protein [Winogradskyella sp. DF17]MBO3117159.1 hypothetical protein [Winogradskyella sp. DF17]
MKLINSRFSSKIEVNGDPLAKRTTAAGVTGYNAAGNLAKSYYFRKEDNLFWLETKKAKWKQLGEYVFMYTKMQLK